jgi:hypothetical protein
MQEPPFISTTYELELCKKVKISYRWRIKGGDWVSSTFTTLQAALADRSPKKTDAEWMEDTLPEIAESYAENNQDWTSLAPSPAPTSHDAVCMQMTGQN